MDLMMANVLRKNSNYSQKFDIFALSFQFTFGNNEKEKKTEIGGLISVAILIVSQVYFGYLCYLYFQNKVQPQVVSSNIFQKYPYDMQFKQNFIAIQVKIPRGQNLDYFQQQTGKIYLNILGIHKTGSDICALIQVIQGMRIIFSPQHTTPDNLELNSFNIVFGICKLMLIKSPYTCEDEQGIRNTLISYNTQITVRISLTQFNTQKKKLEQRIVKEPCYLDSDLGFYTKFHLQKTDLTLQQGFTIQNSDYNTYFSGYTPLFILQQIGQGEDIKREQQRGLDKLINYIKNQDFKNLGNTQGLPKIQLQVVFSNMFKKQQFTMHFQESFLAIQIIMPSGQNLYDFQQQTGKVYLNILFVKSDSGIDFQATPQPLIPCRDNNLQGYLCLDSSKFGDGDNNFSLTYNRDNLEQYQYSIIFGICDPKYIKSPYICEDELVIRNTLISYSAQIIARINLNQFNTQTKQLEQRTIKEPFYFDITWGFYTQFHLQKTDLTKQQGLIIQNSEYSTYFSGFVRRDIFSSQQLIKSQLQMNVLGTLEFFIGSESINLKIQFPQFTSLLAQFTSVFNSSLFLGIISKLFAESEIFSQVAEMQLKVYFKKSALFILKQLGQGENLQKDQKKKDEDKLFQKIIYIFLGQIQKKEKETIYAKMLKQTVNQSNKALNIFEIQKELLQMKIIMRLILSVEQYAAIQLCGSKLPIFNEMKNEQDQEFVEDIKCEDSYIFNQVVSEDYKLEKSNKIKEDKQNNFEGKTQNNVLSFSKEKQDSVRKFNGTIYPLSIEQQEFDKRKSDRHIKLISHLDKIDMIERDEGFFKACLDKFLQNKSNHNLKLIKEYLNV
ncbi:hypothetical protein ABPG72_018437 [Tetrahymena utriculariae]